jgi:hypothetical protein
MLTRDQAQRIAEAEISRRAKYSARVQSESTIELDYGWLFFWNSVTFLETGDRRFALVGNAPLLVNRSDGTTSFTGTARVPSHYLREYEESIGLRGPASLAQVARGTLYELWLRMLGRRWTTSLSSTTKCDCRRCKIAASSGPVSPNE